MKLGVFGGSFDPVHYGHLLLAEYCRDLAALDRVLFMPASRSPLKSVRPIATDKQRIEMIMLAIGGNEYFEVSNVEIDRGGASYTVDTLEDIRAQHLSDELFLMIGGDSLRYFSKWKKPDRICELSIPLVVARRGFDAAIDQLAPFISAERMELVRRYQIDFPVIEISSTEIRRSIRAGQSIRYRTPRAVEKYIETQHLYADAKPQC